MLQNIIDWLKKLFGVAPRKTPAEQALEAKQQAAYEGIDEFNVTAIAANRVANIVAEDASVEVDGEGPRAEYIRRSIERITDRLKLISARALGTGGVWLVPYSAGTELYADIIEQPRFFGVEQRGEVLTKVQYVADVQAVSGSEYVRAVQCTLSEAGLYTIENKATREGVEVPLTAIPAWAEIPPIVSIPGVERMLIGFIKCPTDNKASANVLRGVPLTYGQDQLVQMILDILGEVPAEYKLKRAFVGASDSLFNGKNKLPEDGLYKRFDSIGEIGDKPFWEVFSPDIRHTAYFDGLDYLFGLLERAIGVSKGILTDLESADATATAIRRGSFDTFNLVDAMRRNIETGLDQIAYAFDVLATAYGFAPRGDWKLTFDWSYSLIEDTAEKWQQMLAALGAGIMRPEELRAWLLDIDEKEALKGLPALADETGVVVE